MSKTEEKRPTPACGELKGSSKSSLPSLQQLPKNSAVLDLRHLVVTAPTTRLIHFSS